jgi:hypothetical protein
MKQMAGGWAFAGRFASLTAIPIRLMAEPTICQYPVE